MPRLSNWCLDVKAISTHKQQLMGKNNQNSFLFKPNSYILREKVLVHEKEGKKYEHLYKGPYPITKVWTNRTDAIR